MYKVLDVKLGSLLKVMRLFSQVGYGENEIVFPKTLSTVDCTVVASGTVHKVFSMSISSVHHNRT